MCKMHYNDHSIGRTQFNVMISDPDKWRTDSDHGMTKEDSLEHFKVIQNAYDFLMSRFDDDEDDRVSN